MKVDTTVLPKADTFVIVDAWRAPGRGVIDPITVILFDFQGSGKIIVECFGAAWSNWFGAIGSGTLRQFLAGCDDDYLASKLITTTCRNTTKREETYLRDIARAIIASLKEPHQ